MCPVLLGLKRVYIVLLCWQRVTDCRCALSRSLAHIDRVPRRAGLWLCGLTRYSALNRIPVVLWA
jgi:hypothetical protein